jgi:hypothetical protein
VPRPPLDPETLELLRAASGLAIDDEGRFLHRGEPITHARTLEVLWRSLEPAAAGRWLVRVGRESAYVDVGETPWRVRGVLAQGDAAPLVLLSDGSREPLDPSSLSVGRDGVLRCRVKGGAPARFTRAGQVAMAPFLDEDPPGSGRVVVTFGVRKWTLGTERED